MHTENNVKPLGLVVHYIVRKFVIGISFINASVLLACILVGIDSDGFLFPVSCIAL